MGHYGKHIIDPETGLCEICDKNAIQEVRQGKQLDRQVIHPNNNEIPYEQDRYVNERGAEPTGSYVRKSFNAPTPVRPRRVIYEDTNEEAGATRRIVRHEPTPTKEIIFRPSPRPSTIMYVDKEHQMIPQYRTPPPPASATWYASGPRRQTNSGIEYIQRQPRIGRDDIYYHQTSPRNAGPVHVKVVPGVTRRSSFNSSVPKPRVYQVNGNRQQYQLEPMERTIHNGSEPTIVRKVYKKFPPGRYETSPQRNSISIQTPKQPAVYHIRSGVDY